MRKLNKLAAAVAIVLAGSSVPAGAAVLGGAGEALLIPLVVWSGGNFNDPKCDAYLSGPNPVFPPAPADCNLGLGYTPAVDTVVEVWIPASIGYDAIPNIYTASNTTPTWGPPLNQAKPNGSIPTETQMTPADPELLSQAGPAIHWYWFDKRSQHLADRSVSVTPNDVVQLSWTELADGAFENSAGYMVIGNESAANGDAATFSIFGNAWITGALHFTGAQDRNLLGVGFPLIGGSIPVLAMTDGVDGPDVGVKCAQPSADDSVKYHRGVPCAVSPLVSGFRTGRSDGDTDIFAWDMALSNRMLPTIQVIWMDHNLDSGPLINAAYPAQPLAIPPFAANTGSPTPLVQYEVFDLDELSCSSSVTLPNEVNALWIPPVYEHGDPLSAVDWWNQPFAWTSYTDLCSVTDQNPMAPFTAGFVRYIMDEYIDNDINAAQSAGFAFSIKIDGMLVNNDSLNFVPEALVLMLETSLGHDLGTFKR